MKLALTVWGNRISPVFDSARTLMVVELRDGLVQSRRLEPCRLEPPFFRASWFTSLGVDELICGAITRQTAQGLESVGVHVIGFITGEVEEILEAYTNGRLAAPRFAMPGCGGRHRKQGRGGRGRQRRRSGTMMKGD